MKDSIRYYLIKGLVQGVGYRYFVKTTAQNLNVSGWVRNLKSKQVELLAFTNTKTHNKLYEALNQGPPNAKVEQVLQKEISEIENIPEGFEILETRESPCYKL